MLTAKEGRTGYSQAMTTMRSAGRDFGDSDQTRLADEQKERLRLEAEILRRAALELTRQRARTANGRGAPEEASYVPENGTADDELTLTAEDDLAVSDPSSRSSTSGPEESQSIFNLPSDRGALVTLILDEGSPDRRREIAAELAGSPIIGEAISDLNGATRDKIYLAFSLLFLIAKTGEIQPLLQAIEDHPSLEVRLEVIKLLTLTREPHVAPAFRDLTTRSSLPIEVQLAIMNGLDQIPSDLGSEVQCNP